jgi:hypothetical protein
MGDELSERGTSEGARAPQLPKHFELSPFALPKIWFCSGALVVKKRMSNFAYSIVEVPGESALAELKDLRQGRRYPVLLGDPRNLERLAEAMSETDESSEALVRAAERLDPQEWLLAREGIVEEVDSGEWPDDAKAGSGITAHLQTGNKPLPSVSIALIPTDAAWKVPCYLKLGGWNECPFAPEQASLFRKWEAEYGAKIVAVTSDTIECEVANPPTTRLAAMKLAREQALFCSDIVSQGTGTVEALAATLLHGLSWYFWWD